LAQGNLSLWIDSSDHHRTARVIRAACWVITISAGLLQAWAARFSPSPDATNYLDMATAVLRGDWKNAVNAYWSPLFSWLLALGLKIMGPKPYRESTLLQLINFAALLFALWSFEFFFRAFLRSREHAAQASRESEPLSQLGWRILGYGLFLSTAFFVQSATATTPDVWVSVFTFLAAGLVLRIRTDGADWRRFALLGFILGCAYLTKAFYFPMSFVFLATAFLAAPNPRRNIKQAAVGLAVFFLVAGPWIATLSRAKHRITFGDVGKLNYVKLVDQIPNSLAWQGENGTGIPQHPVRQLLAHPHVYEFAAPVGGTYPPGFDWSYWMEGARPRFNLRGQLSVLRQSVGTFFWILLTQIEYGVALLVLFFLAFGKSNWTLSLRRQWHLWIPALLACLTYALVLVEGRYVAPFVLFLWVAGFSCFFQSASELSRRVALALVLSVVSLTGLRLAKFMEADLVGMSFKQRNIDWEVSQALRAVGIHSGDRVAAISAVGEVQWARLAGVKVVSEIPFAQEDAFWNADPETQRKVFEILARTGARIVVTKQPPTSATHPGWIPLGSTGFFAYRLLVQGPDNP
jgi:4-amino-4-deoxy-L-arabinose transferase-like glycosyltransferase